MLTFVWESPHAPRSERCEQRDGEHGRLAQAASHARGSLPTGDGHARPPPGRAGARTRILLEDRAQSPQRPLMLAPEPAAGAEALHQPVRELRGPRLQGEGDAGGAARPPGRAARRRACECGCSCRCAPPRRSGAGRSTSANVTSAQPKRLNGAATRKRAPAPRPTESIRVRCQSPQEVVGELRVVGDVLQVVEDGLARGRDDCRDAERDPRRAQVYCPACRASAPRADEGRSDRARGEPHGLPVRRRGAPSRAPRARLAAAGCRARRRAAAGARAGPRRGPPARRSAACGRSRRRRCDPPPARRGCAS